MMMMLKSTALLLSLHFLGALSSPTFHHQARDSSCTPKSGAKDDTPAIMNAISKCGDGGTITLPQGEQYTIDTPLDFKKCKGCKVHLEGTLKATSDVDKWSKENAIIVLKNVNGLTLTSTKGTGVIDGNGQDAWDAFAKNKNLKRPRLISVAGCTDITVSNLYLKNPPTFFIAQNGGSSNVHYSDLTLYAHSKSDSPAKNTDGIDIGDSKYTTIKNVHITNFDDCIAFKPGCDYLDVNNVTCAGNSHGLSVGSLGKGSDDKVTNVYVKDAHMINATKAAGIKVYDGSKGRGTPYVKNVTWENVHVDNCDYAAQIQSCYGISGDKTCNDTPSKAELYDVKFLNFHGTVSKKYAPVDANINCPGAGKCDVSFDKWDISVPGDEKAYALCAAQPKDLPINCHPGAFR
ncbi:endo-xylogalacturonan hydrolase [Ascosphaera apis ARSEF 7405]|uniref:Endo-xylogalacturonan hydrolase n=1 Tax=Ascosphaera apis ARSEF 7405 TaxID=392613 RepID=A0A167V5N2_9EURO|nr:endo-xylogalacturonan hydrolase [Ascosphaera apis ARSEF 7405]